MISKPNHGQPFESAPVIVAAVTILMQLVKKCWFVVMHIVVKPSIKRETSPILKGWDRRKVRSWPQKPCSNKGTECLIRPLVQVTIDRLRTQSTYQYSVYCNHCVHIVITWTMCVETSVHMLYWCTSGYVLQVVGVLQKLSKYGLMSTLSNKYHRVWCTLSGGAQWVGHSCVTGVHFVPLCMLRFIVTCYWSWYVGFA